MTKGSKMHDALRQVIAVLEEERQALAGLDLDAILIASQDKERLTTAIEACGTQMPELDEESRAMLDSARRLNEVNRQVRNLVAANVEARLGALTGSGQLYRANAYRYAGQAAR
ncbi:MAG: flagellar protein FlgN [Novosphingobium sp.]|nr:flagellar protein FlgN [Novosphingobium sp.]